MKRAFGLLIVVSACIFTACKTRHERPVYFLSPEEGSTIRHGQSFTMKLDAGSDSFDSVTYLLDTGLIASRKDTASVTVPTSKLPLGIKVLTARIYNGGEYNEVTTNIVLIPDKAPVKYSYSVVNVFPHDTSSYTEGLEYHDGYLYESAGLKGESSLRKAELRTGKVLQKVDLDDKYFGEGITVVGDKIIQLTYQEGVGFVYDKNTFKKLSEFPYQAGREGWGLYFDGKQILNTDGTNNIYLLNKDTYQKEGTLGVYDINGAVDNLNELEMVDGKIYANIYQTDNIAIINPQSGAVEGIIDLSELYPEVKRNAGADVLNGIAWDPTGRRLFVTGKKWDKLFEIKVKEL